MSDKRERSTAAGKYQPKCMLAHDVINRLTVIVGYCDLLALEAPEDSECRKRLLSIREIAQMAAKDLREGECRFELVTQKAARENTSSDCGLSRIEGIPLSTLSGGEPH